MNWGDLSGNLLGIIRPTVRDRFGRCPGQALPPAVCHRTANQKSATRDGLAAAAPARLEAVFLPRSGGGVHRQGQGQRTLRVRCQGFDRHHQCPRGSCCTPGRAISAAAISKVAPAMPPTSSSAPSFTTFASFASSYSRYSRPSQFGQPSNRFLNGRLGKPSLCTTRPPNPAHDQAQQ